MWALVWSLNGRKLIALAADTIIIEAALGVRHTFRRRTAEPGEVVLPWQLSAP